MIKKLEKNENIITSGIFAARREFPANTDIPMHWHDFIELEYIIRGSGKNIIDGKAYDIKENTLFFTIPTNFHKFIFDEETILVNITLSETFCDYRLLFSLAANNQNAISFLPADSPFVNNLIFELVSAVENNNIDYSALLTETLIMKINQLIQLKSADVTNYVESAIIYIINKFRSNISLSAAAEYAGITPAYLSALFVKETGINFKEYLNSIRYNYAKNLLKYSKMNISEICYESGFEDYSNFLRGFKARFGISPGKFKKERKT